LKVFISYASEDLQAASSVFNEVAGAGAEVFQFGRSEIVGKPSWYQVLEWISQSDVFVLLVSKHSLKSKPVKEELEQAHYSYINSDRPEKLVPAILEAGAKPPRLIERFTHVDFTQLDAGIDRLLNQLNLVRGAKKASALRYELPNLSKVFEEFKLKNPDPLPASIWSADAESLLASYKAPKTLGKTEVREQLDWLLKEDSFKRLAESHSLSPRKTPKPITPLTQFKPGSSDNFLVPVDTPQPKLSGRMISWPAVTDAKSYEIQKSLFGQFGISDNDSVYNGSQLKYTVPDWEFGSYRVRAIGRIRPDSEWSVPIKVKVISTSITGIEPADPAFLLKPPGSSISDVPKLKQKLNLYPELTWSFSMPLAKYVLECSQNEHFFGATVVYEGFLTEWTGTDLSFKKNFYRVKAVDAAGNESGWSNVVTC
jgi:hypothetical protein